MLLSPSKILVERRINFFCYSYLMVFHRKDLCKAKHDVECVRENLSQKIQFEEGKSDLSRFQGKLDWSIWGVSQTGWFEGKIGLFDLKGKWHWSIWGVNPIYPEIDWSNSPLDIRPVNLPSNLQLKSDLT